MNTEIEARFLEIDNAELIAKLKSFGAKDKGGAILSETIFYDGDNRWPDEGRFVRIRSYDGITKLTYKHNVAQTIDSAREIELTVPDPRIAEQFLEAIGLTAFRRQEKKRHTFEFENVIVDIDTWPQIPTYVEFEGKSVEAVKSVAAKLGFDWSKVVFDDARAVIQGRYNIDLSSIRWFTFDKVE